MEENSATMQTLVLAHAAMGHNHFFKNNYRLQAVDGRFGHRGLSVIRQELSSPSARSATGRRVSSG
jgi:spore cortex formation protein SpoVR/YcgB (stage V sporulation)